MLKINDLILLIAKIESFSTDFLSPVMANSFFRILPDYLSVFWEEDIRFHVLRNDFSLISKPIKIIPGPT